ncbi:SURF1 family protein [Pelagibacteraceae bacterium]|nr:SURF1 family protein [Pelagibacteraceae bacterium]
MKNQLLFNIFVLSVITLFCALGTWQLVRLQWKNTLIDQISEGLKSSPINYSEKIKANYQRVTIEGNYDFEKQIYLYSLNDKGQPGYDVITPFKSLNSENVLVNRGWIESNLKNNDIINRTINNKIQGLILKNVKPNVFKPENDTEANIWFSINLEQIQEVTGKNFNNYILYLENKKINIPKPKKITIDLPNNHLKYAITWYSISISIFGYFLYFRKKNEIL